MKTIRLGDLAAIDISNVDKKAKAEETSVTLCNFVDVYHNWIIDDSNTRSLMQTTARQTQIERFSLRHGQVAITKDSETRDDIGIPTFIDKVPDKTVLGYHCALITPIDNMLDGAYLNCILQTDYAKKYFECNASGSGQRYTLTVEVIADFPVPLPSLDEQIKRAEIFTAIHRALFNSQSICSDLEATAKLLYDYWFVQFDFPDENGRPYKSSGGKMVWNDELKREIPDGWTVSVLSNLCETRLGGTPDTDNQDYWDGDLPWLSSGEVAKSPILKSEKRITERGLEESPTSFAPAGSVLLSITRYIRPSLLAIDACFNQSVVAILESDNLKASFIYPLITNEIPRYMMLRTGAQQPHINKETVDSTFVVVPPTALLNKYYETADRLLDLLVSTAKESEELTVTRDFLLPILMNGQVTIGDDGE